MYIKYASDMGEKSKENHMHQQTDNQNGHTNKNLLQF